MKTNPYALETTMIGHDDMPIRVQSAFATRVHEALALYMRHAATRKPYAAGDPPPPLSLPELRPVLCEVVEMPGELPIYCMSLHPLGQGNPIATHC